MVTLYISFLFLYWLIAKFPDSSFSGLGAIGLAGGDFAGSGRFPVFFV